MDKPLKHRGFREDGFTPFFTPFDFKNMPKYAIFCHIFSMEKND